jgi:Acyl-CoA dehydrogenases
MKTPLDAPEKQIAEETSAQPAKTETQSVIDTSKMSAGKAAALDLAESSRDPLDERGSFASNLFIGRYDFDASFPTRRRARRIVRKAIPSSKNCANISRLTSTPTKSIAPAKFRRRTSTTSFAMGAFGVKIPTQYGGLGLSQMNYGRAAMLLGSWDANLTALVSAHQSIGVPQPLLIFGTEEQKKKYLPRVARKEISAFALTETDAGSDPANMSLRAEATEDGSAFILNGEKLWCTNLIKAGVLVVMAKTAPKIVKAGSASKSRPSS